MFNPGDRVAWDHVLGAVHDNARSVILASAVAPGVPIGTIVGTANEQETWFDVDFDGDVKTLTCDELVRVTED